VGARGIKRVAGMIRMPSLSPAGVRVAIEARGDIFTVPVEKGDYRNLTRSTAVNDRDPCGRRTGRSSRGSPTRAANTSS
jgi:tricorn protease